MALLVVSGAGSGIGRSIIETLDKQNNSFSFVMLDINKERLESLNSELKEPKKNYILESCTTDKLKIRKFIEENNLVTKNIVGVVANAGIAKENIYGENDNFDEIININLKGPYVLINEFLPSLENSKQDFKNIIFISSLFNRVGAANYSAYSASKSGVIGLMRSYAKALCSKNILVNAISPGWVETKMAIDGIENMASKNGISYNEMENAYLKTQLFHKMCRPEEIASLVSYLLSLKQRSITGQDIHINNGSFFA